MDNTKIKQSAIDGALVTGGVVAVGLASKKVLGQGLGTPMSGEGILKLGAAIVGGSVLVEYARQKGWLEGWTK